MFDLLGIKKLKMKNTKLEDEITQLREYVVKVNEENARLIKQHEEYKKIIKTLSDQLIAAQDEIKMRKLQEVASKRYTDDSKFY
jgi:FtsZ-binding cell division protein ZapB